MADYIKRKDALQHKRKMSSADFGGEFWDYAVLCEDIEKIPTADVAEVRHGCWKQVRYTEANLYLCSECDATEYKCHKYCPNCGAKMDGRGEG